MITILLYYVALPVSPIQDLLLASITNQEGFFFFFFSHYYLTQGIGEGFCKFNI